MAEPARARDGEALPERIELWLKWRQTWAEREYDYVAAASGYSGDIGRIYRFESGPTQGQWLWSLTDTGAEISHNTGNTSGLEASPRLAAKCVEDAWFAAIRGSSFDVPLVRRNAYAAAKHPE